MNSSLIIFLLLLFLITVVCHDALLQTKFQILRTIGGNVTETENIERIADLEFPRRNPTILLKLNQMWEKYYKCLEANANVDKKPEIRRLQQGQYTELQCEICARPFQSYEELEWQYKTLYPYGDGTDSLQNLILTPEMVLTPNKTLKIYNAVESLAGLYVCYRKDSVITVYILEVSQNDTLVKKETEKGDTKVISLQKNNFLIYHSWSEWTECNACGRVGGKFKYGTCYITLKEGGEVSEKKVFERNGLLRSTKDFHNLMSARYRALKRKILNKLKSKNFLSGEFRGLWSTEILEKFSTGIPCASQYLPMGISESIKEFKAVKVFVKRCWESCEKTEIFVATDCKGTVIESANNSAGIYSMFQEFPRLPPEVERRTISAEFGHDLFIHCPGTSLTDTPPIWKVENKILIPEVIANDSKQRITIDLLSRIYIKRLRLADSHTYSCWHKKQLVGTVRLIVEKKFSFRLNHHVILILTLAALLCLLFLGRKLISRELDMQNK